MQIVNQPVLGGGFRHYSGLLPDINGAGDAFHSSVRIFAMPAADATNMFRGDIVVSASGAIGTPGGADLPANIGPPVTGLSVIGNGGGSLLGNGSIAPNIARWVPGDTTSLIVGSIVGWGPVTLFMAKNGFQYRPASTQAWAFVETDPDMEFAITMPTVPAPNFAGTLNDGYDVQANAGFQATRFGISGVSLNPGSVNTTSTLPLRLLNSDFQIGNDPTSVGAVAKVTFNKTRHYKGTGAFVAD